MPPAVHALPENGPPRLGGPGGAPRPVVLIKSHAPLLERQRTVLEEPANLGLGVLDHGFVEYTMYAARQHPINVGHQVDVVAIIAPEIGEVIGKTLAAGELLFERREAAAERMPSGIDDLGVRQNKMYQAHVQPIIGHFIDEERCLGLAIDAG